MLKFTYFIFVIVCVFQTSFQQAYEVPEATVELLYPSGFSVSIADETGVKIFAFHGKINEEFYTREAGTYSRDIRQSKNGKWTFTDKETKFKIGDTIYYWLYVDYFDGIRTLGYLGENRKFVVTECPRNIVDEQGHCNAQVPDIYEIPDADIEILHPRGFSVSIPEHKGIQLFAFHGKINEEFDGREAGEFSVDINKPINGRWTFKNTNTKLKSGDILYYWLYVIYQDNKGSELGHLKEHQKYVVPGTSETSCIKSTTTWSSGKTCSGQLLFYEEFDFLNSNNWTRDIRFADDPDYEFVIYDNFEENLYIKNGELHIKPTLADDRYGEGFIYSREGYNLGHRCTGRPNILYDCKRRPTGGYPLPPVFSARLESTIYFKYGRVDVRAKLPKGDWIYPQLTLTPRLNEYGAKNYDSGEIRIAFVGGNSNLNAELQSMILLGTSVSARAFNIQKITRQNENWSDSYHIYSTIWKSDSVTFLVDNHKYGEIVPPPGGFANIFMQEKSEAVAKWKSGSIIAPFDKEMLINIGVGVGGHSFPDTISGKPYTNVEPKPQTKFYRSRNTWKPSWNDDSQLIVDYIKIFAL